MYPRFLVILTLFVLLPCPVARAQDSPLDAWRNADARTQAAVLTLARQAFDAYVTHRSVIDPPAKLSSPLWKQRTGVFVSTMRFGAPRCCMGTLYPVQPNLAEEIIANAVAAAGRDHRFAPVKKAEMDKLTLIVSIVGRPRPITEAEAENLDPARDGLVVKKGDRCGVVLSGETPHRENMIPWGRSRAGARPAEPVQFFQIEDVRFMETMK